MSYADKIKSLVGQKPLMDKRPTTVITVSLTEETAERLLANPPAELAGHRLLSIKAEAPVDLGKLARKAVRAKRARCAHLQSRFRQGRQVCRECGDSFPCAGRCEHLNCIELGYANRIRTGFPRDFAFPLEVLARGHRGGDDCPGCAVAPEDHHEYLVDPDVAPEQWITAIPLERAP